MAKPKTLIRAADRPSRTFARNVVEELTILEQEVGGRRGLMGLLMLAPQSRDLQHLLGMIGDPDHDQKSLAAILALGNLSPGDLMEQLRKAALLRGQTVASLYIAKGLPAVVKDVLRKAAPYEEACGACLGTGAITPDPTPANPNPTHAPCPTCAGGGKLLYQPDLDTQKVALEIGQMLQKGGGINMGVVVNQASGGAGGGMGSGSLEKIQQLTDRILYEGPPDAIDAEVEEVEDAPAPDA